MSITDSQLINVVHATLADILVTEFDRKIILTNDPKIATVLCDLGKKQGCTKLSNVYFVTEDRDWATNLYMNFGDKSENFLPIDNTYVAPLNEFIKEFRRKFDYILLNIEALSLCNLNMVCEAITHGAKDNGVVCIITSYDDVEKAINEKIGALTENLIEVFCSDLPDTKKLHVYLNSVAIATSATPWIITREQNHITDEFKDLLKPPLSLRPPVANGEVRFLGTKNHVVLSFLMRYISGVCVNLKSYLTPRQIFLIDDEKSSIGVAYTSRVYRGLPSMSQKVYKNKCLDEIGNHIPHFYSLSGDSTPKRLRDIKDGKTEEVILKAPFISKLGRSTDELIVGDRYYQKLNEIIKDSGIPSERIKEIQTWINENGGLDTIDINIVVEKLSEYPELKNLINKVLTLTGKS